MLCTLSKLNDSELEQITSLEKAIMGVNNRLSHPEQVKRWAILLNDLSIENGDLTANLKIKRQILTGRFLKIIEALYGELQPTMENLIHIGGRSLNEP